MTVSVYLGESLARYGFGEDHPFGSDRLSAFWQHMIDIGLDKQIKSCVPVSATRDELLLFQTADYIDQVIRQSKTGQGYLDAGDTPAFVGVYEAACTVVGSVLDAVSKIMRCETDAAFVPIAGLHHAAHNMAAGFCVFNDCCIAIQSLRNQYGLKRIAYVDIDAHHGDGVFYAFETDPDLIFVDLHEDGRYLYPGTGHSHETGRGQAKGTKLNIPMPSGATDEDFLNVWSDVENHLEKFSPEFFILQCGADSLAGDPITHMRYSAKAHYHAASCLKALSIKHAQGRILALGGGGYNRENLALAWTAVIKGLK